ncbi:MAG: hypothetical protein WBJ84_02030 [Bacteroidales bacterium]
MNEKMKSDMRATENVLDESFFRRYVHQIIQSAFGDDEKLDDWQAMTFRQVLSEIERCFPETIIFWGAYTEEQLDFIL